jgi:hypothetical protein
MLRRKETVNVEKEAKHPSVVSFIEIETMLESIP